MSSAFYPFRNSRIHYFCWGNGPRLLFCFHGYGESAASFALLEASLGEEFTLVAIDLPFHGETEWAEDGCFDAAGCLAILQDIAAGLPGRNPGWVMLGYSMGGRVALHLLGLAPEKISRLVLLAPDGLFVNPWYWLATRTHAGNRLFRWTMKKPGWLFFLLNTGNRLRLVNRSLFKFAAHYIDDEAERKALYTRWTTMRLFRPRLRVLIALIRQRSISVRLFYGKFDRIIRSRRGERFIQRIQPFGQLDLLAAGHALLQPKFIEVISNAVYLPLN